MLPTIAGIQPYRESKCNVSGVGQGLTTAGWPFDPGGVNTPAKEAPMANFMSYYLVPIAIIAVAIVLLLGLINMMRGGSGNRSQKLMRLRVLLQFVAIIVIMATIWVMKG